MHCPRAIPILFVCLALAGSAFPTRATSLSAEDIAKIKQVHREFEAAWLKGDADGVRALFTEDCVLLPHHGERPRIGKKQMNEFWFPTDGPLATVTKLKVTLESIEGDGQTAYVWGEHEVAWTTVQDGKTSSSSNKGTFLNILRKQPNGDWKISHHMWDDPVAQQRQGHTVAILLAATKQPAHSEGSAGSYPSASCALSSGTSDCDGRRQLDLCSDGEARTDERSRLLFL